MPPLERFVLHRLWELDGQVRAAYRDYRFNDVWRPVSEFCRARAVGALLRHPQGRPLLRRPLQPAPPRRRTVMDAVFERLTVWLSPILPFTCEEAWTTRFHDAGSNCLRIMPESPETWRDEAEAKRWPKVKWVLENVTSALEAQRREKQIGSALEAAPVVTVFDTDMAQVFRGLDAAEVFRTSQATLITTAPKQADRDEVVQPSSDEARRSASSAVEGFAMVTTSHKAEGEKCARCWRILPEVHAPKHLCERCEAAVAEIEAVA